MTKNFILCDPGLLIFTYSLTSNTVKYRRYCYQIVQIKSINFNQLHSISTPPWVTTCLEWGTKEGVKQYAFKRCNKLDVLATSLSVLR